MATTQPPVQLHRGIVKQVLTGDSIVVRGQPKGGPPPERTICLSNVVAPKLARRANPNVEASVETKDEPFAWEAREFLRKKLIGKEVTFTVEYKVPGSDREYGVVYSLGNMQENITESMVSDGLLEVRRLGIKPSDDQTKLIDLEELAKAAGKGKWSQEPDIANRVRDISWNLENPRHFVDSHHNKPVQAIVEYVRDGCTMRAFLLPSFQYVTVMLSGIKCPMFKMEDNKQVMEQYAQEAKFFVESRLLQRDVNIILEGVSNQNLLGTVLHPNGNITELLLKEGFARCVDWSMGVVTQGAEKLRAAEKIAKEKRLRIWKDYVPSNTLANVAEKEFSAKVMEIVNGDALVVKPPAGENKKIFLSSIRPPRPQDVASSDMETKRPAGRVRPLYDIPYMFEAREFLRKKLIGKKVNVLIDYIQPPSDAFPEKTCCTVTIGSINVAEALISKGLATVIRYRQDDDHRSSEYDTLLAAESRAQKNGKGLHSKKEVPIHRVADIAGDLGKAKQFLPFLQRAKKSEAIVEFVVSGSRLRLFIPRETCLITFLLAGINCPRVARTGPAGVSIEGEPYGNEALQFTRELLLQREVEVEVESMDKAGNFIGWLFIDGANHSVSLVEEGLASVHFTAERSQYYKQLVSVEESAKQRKEKIWENFVEQAEPVVEPEKEEAERKINYKKIIITEVLEDLHFYAQHAENGPQLTQLMEQLRAEMTSTPPLPGAYKPKKGDLVAAKFSLDSEWYRARIEKVTNIGAVCFYVDYGNRENVSTSSLAVLPSQYHLLSPQAHEYALACVTLPNDTDAIQDAREAFAEDTANHQFYINNEYRDGKLEYVSLVRADTDEDVAKGLVDEGLVIAEARREKRLQKLVSQYQKAMESAKSSRRNLWRYGDITEDDAKEFGYNV